MVDRWRTASIRVSPALPSSRSQAPRGSRPGLGTVTPAPVLDRLDTATSAQRLLGTATSGRAGVRRTANWRAGLADAVRPAGSSERAREGERDY